MSLVMYNPKQVNKCSNGRCCPSHCKVSNHHTMLWKKALQFTNPFNVLTIVDVEMDEIEQNKANEVEKMSELDFTGDKMLGDCLTDLLISVHSNLSGKV